MITCHICGEQKDKEKFSYIPYFRKFKRHDVTWCHGCQKMYMQMKKEKQRVQEFVQDATKFIVSFR